MSSKKDELEKLIQDSYNIVRQNDQQILTADPRIQLRLQQENDKNWQYIKTYLAEYASLCEFRRLSALDDIIDIAATRFPDLAERLETAPQARQDTLTKHPAAPAPAPPPSRKKDQNPLLKLFTKEQKEPALLFGISYKFLHPYMASDREGLAQFTLAFSSNHDTSVQQRDIVTHICLVLDISGSMDAPDKYPYLLQAIPYIIDALPDNDWLSIILFSDESELIWSRDIINTRSKKQDIFNRINRSPIKFGQTNLSSGLEIAISKIKQFRQNQPRVVNRLYVLTDGQLTDATECYRFNAALRYHEVEINAYGFGTDFAEGTMRRIMEGCQGARVKRVSNTDTLWQSFHHIGEVAQNIIATDAELMLDFSPEVTPGDSFRVDPGRYWFGSADDKGKNFYIHLGSLEKKRVYTYAFEARVYPSQQSYERIAVSTLRYLFQGEQQIVTQDVFIERVAELARCTQIDPETEMIFSSLEELRSDDPASKMRSYQARLKILRSQGGDPAQIQLLEQAIKRLSLGGSSASFSEQELRYLDADSNSTHARIVRFTD